MKFILKLFTGLIITVAFLALVGFIVLRLTLSLALDDIPAQTKFDKASLEDLQRIKVLAVEFQRNNSGANQKTVTLKERDINLGIGHFAPTQINLPKSVFTAVTLDQNTGAIKLTLPASLAFQQAESQLISQTPRAMHFILGYIRQYTTDKWINLTLPVKLQHKQPKENWIDTGSIILGSITLTEGISDTIIHRLIQNVLQSKQAPGIVSAWDNIDYLSITNSELEIRFRLPNNQNHLINSYQSLVLSTDEIEQVNHYVSVLRGMPKRGSLVSVLRSLFKEAKDRSTTNNDPVGENKAALLALSKLYGGDQLLAMIDANPAQLLMRTPKPYNIYKRRDLAQHYILSAGLTLIADESLAELIGIDKEMSDLMGGRTMSAWDLMADRAGVRLAKNATRSAKRAREVQIALSRAKLDRDILPDLAKNFAFSGDSFAPNEIAELTTLIDLTLDDHPILKK